MKTNLKTFVTTLATAALSLSLQNLGQAASAEESNPPGQRPPHLQPVHAAKLNTTPRGFIPKVGQMPNQAVKFALRDGGVTAFFTDQGFVLWNGQTTTISQDGHERKVPVAPRWSVVGTKPVMPIGGDTFEHTVSFFRGNDPAKWHANVPAYRDLRYPEILNGVELRVEQRERGFEYSFHVQPHAKPDLRFRYDGITALEKSATGDLLVRTATGHFTESRPVSFQFIDGIRREVQSSFEIVSANEYRIALGAYDARHELVIDPVLDWSTSVGGSYGDQFNSAKVAANGDIVCAGWTYSWNLPVTPGFGTAPGGNQNDGFLHADAYVAKFSADGTMLLWAGYLTGTGANYEAIFRNKSLALDSAGDVYVTGFTSSDDFPVVPPGSSSHSGDVDAFITKIKADGSAILWSRLLGSAHHDQGVSLALDAAENLYIAGTTDSAAFAGPKAKDLFLAKLDGSGGVLWTRFLGGSMEERICAMVADQSGVILFGDTDSVDFGATVGDTTLDGGNDSFVSKFDLNGIHLWSTYLGGSAAETGHPNLTDPTYGRGDLVLNSAGHIIVGGHTYSTDFPGTSGGFQNALKGGNDAFVAALSSDGTSVLWSSYLGGFGGADSVGREEIVMSLAINPWDEIFIGGWTRSPNFPVTAATALKASKSSDGTMDGFLTKVSKQAGSPAVVEYSSYIGNNGWDDVLLGLEYHSGTVLINGWHLDSFTPITPGSYQVECDNCGADTFLAKFLDAYIAHDGFESGNYSGGEGWTGNWTATGDISILTSSGPHSGTRHVRLRSSTGYLQRTVNVPPGSTSVRLGFWAKADSFEGSDQAVVLAKSTGASFTTVASFTSVQSDNKYHYYELDLTSFLPATQIQIAFDAAMNANNDNWYLDDIRLTGTSTPVPPVANAGADQTVTDTDNTGAETVTLNGSASFDPDGGGIVSYEWKEGATVLGTDASINTSLSVGVHTITLTVTDDEGATASDTVQVTVNPYVAAIEVFYDSFEVSEWNGLWTEDSQNDWFRSTQRATQGTRSAEVDGNASDASLTSINVPLPLGLNNATITFDWLIESGLDSGEYVEFRVSTNGGSTWTQKAILRGNVDPENSWRSVTVELTGINQLKLQFRGKMDKDDEDANVDNVRVVAH
jgi:hypothetical protein